MRLKRQTRVWTHEQVLYFESHMVLSTVYFLFLIHVCGFITLVSYQNLAQV